MPKRIKKGVSIRGLHPQMLVAWDAVEEVYDEYNVDAVLTSAVDGTHSLGSLHYVGYAIDTRTRDFPTQAQKQEARDKIAEILGAEFDVVLEANHIHIEFQPKGQVE